MCLINSSSNSFLYLVGLDIDIILQRFYLQNQYLTRHTNKVKRVIILGDLHFPFHHKRAFNAVMQRIKSKKFDIVIQIGDLFDQYCFSKFTRKNVMLPDREIKYARDLSVKMWREIKKYQKKAKLYQILGNHDIRLIKRAEEKLPEAQDLIKFTMLELYNFDGVKTISDPRDELILDTVWFTHGFLSKIGDHVKKFHVSCVHGHRHRGEVTFLPIRNKMFFELDVGFLADSNKEPLAYQPTKTNNWTLGWGEIDEFGPRFVPFID